MNWEETGAVFPHRPAWAVGNFWAPEISQHAGKYYIYYVARKKGGPLAVAVASASKPGGPYTDHGPIVAQDAGSIDPVPTEDEHGTRYLLWKEDGNSRRLPTILWAQPLSDDGLKLVGERREILRNDAAWEGAVVEGPFIVKRDGWLYLFYSGSSCCGTGCRYALGVARSKSLLGPWEKAPANPLLAGNDTWRCPGHGSIVQDEAGRYFLLYHAYSSSGFVFTGREALLDEVVFGADGWPSIHGGQGPSADAPSPLGAVQRRSSVMFFDDFSDASIRAGWQWPQDNEPVIALRSSRGGQLQLRPAPDHETNLLGAVLARSTLAGSYRATTCVDVRSLRPGAFAGLAAFGDDANSAGISLSKDTLQLWRRERGRHTKIAEAPLPPVRKLFLRLTAREGHAFQFEARLDGKEWKPLGDHVEGRSLPPWDRAVRVALTAGGVAGAEARFDFMRLEPIPDSQP